MTKIGQKRTTPKRGLKKKKPSQKKLTKQLDDLWTELVKWRADYKCEYCGKVTNLESHHVINRWQYQVRWDLENGVCLCGHHHRLNAKFSAHKNGAIFRDWIVDKRGLRWYSQLKEKASIPPPTDKERALEILLNYQKGIKELEEKFNGNV